MRYMAYPIEQSFKYNRLLLKYESEETMPTSKREELIKKLEKFSDDGPPFFRKTMEG